MFNNYSKWSKKKFVAFSFLNKCFFYLNFKNSTFRKCLKFEFNPPSKAFIWSFNSFPLPFSVHRGDIGSRQKKSFRIKKKKTF